MATDIYWLSGTTGNWFTASNWQGGAIPATGDTAFIESGTAIISATPNPQIEGIAIVLGGDGDPVTLSAINATFEGSGSGAQEIATRLFVKGTLDEKTDATFIVAGATSFDGQIFVNALAGSLTIDVRDDGVTAGVFTLANTDEKAAIVVSQESFLDFEGKTVFNHSLIQIEGGAEISAGVTFTGDDGVFLLENGGTLSVEGVVEDSQHVIFIDGTGTLIIENLAGFHGVIEYAELPTPPGQPAQGIAGGKINLTGVEAQSLAFDSTTGTLNLYAGPNPSGNPVAQLAMQMVDDALDPTTSTLTSADFSLASDGNGGTVITYAPQGATYLLSSLPTPVIAEAGDVISLKTILKEAFGQSDIPFKGVWLLPSKPFENSATDVGYWDTPDVTPEWYIGGKKVTEATYVTDISKVTLHAGNQIDNPASFQIRLTEDKSGPDATFITYDVWTVDPRVIEAMQISGYVPGSAPTAETVVKAAEAFASVYGNGVIPNTNLCNWIADNVAAGAGAPMPLPNTSFDPSLNVEGGFWRIVYAADIPAPPADWYSLVQPGDIIRMGWFKPESGRMSGHSTTALSIVQSDGTIEFYDNVDDGHIGTHDIEYWTHTDPEDITIFRIDPAHQYLIVGSDNAETIRGTVHDNLIRPGGGADTIEAKIGNNEIEGTTAELDGIRTKYFDFGDSFHFTDLDPLTASVTYQNGTLQVFDGVLDVATIKTPKPGAGLSYVVTTDIDGGTTVLLGGAEIEVSGDGNAIPDGDTTPSVTDRTDFGTAAVGDTVIHTFTVTNSGLAALTVSKLALPKGYILVEGLSSTIAPGASDTFQVQLGTKQAGLKAGTLTIKTNDIDETVFNFKLSGLVTAASSFSALTTGLDDAMTAFDGAADPQYDLQQNGAHRGNWHDFDLV
jgi:hypothetical protein